jgi:excisionase family DNA binding protein
MPEVREINRKLTKVLTVNEVAAHLRVAPITVRTWIYQNKLPALKLGGCVRVTEEQLEWFINDCISKSV